MDATPAVIIDASLPRTPYERACKVHEYLVDIVKVMDDSIEALDPGHEIQRLGLRTDWEGWHELEDEIVAKINELLPDDLVCTIGEYQPGDVIVREVQDESEEMA